MKRTLRPSIRTALEIVTAILAVMLVCINDFTVGALPFIIIAICVVVFNLKILNEF